MHRARPRACPRTKTSEGCPPHLGVGAWLALGSILTLPEPPAVLALTVSPTVVELRAATGTQTQGTFRVVNDTEQPVELVVEVEPLAAAGYAPLPPDEWVHVRPSALSLAPRQQAEVVYVVSVPARATGELAAEVVFVQHLGQSGSSGVQVRFGMALYASILGTERLSLRMGPMQVRPGHTPTLLVPVVNEGNVHCRPEGTVTVRRADGELVAHGTLSRGLPAPPSRVEPFTVTLSPGDLPPGPYRVSADLTCPSTAGLPARLRVSQRGELTDDGRWVPASSHDR